MPLPNQDNELEELKEKIKGLEEKIELMENHQHFGTDGSKNLSGNIEIISKNITIEGAGSQIQDFTTIPFVMNDGKEVENKPKRASGIGMAVQNKETANEQIHTLFVNGKIIKLDEVVPTNKTDFDEFNFVQMDLAHNPQGVPASSGPSVFPPFAFLFCKRTPAILGTGSIVNGNDTLVDKDADFKNDLSYSFVVLSNLETRRIVSNTENVITIEGDWESATGDYSYEVVTPVFLGSANYPFTRLYIGDDIRLSYGASGGAQVRYIKWGEGSPEGVVTANPGSLYLNFSGGAGTTLYVKQSGIQTNTGWVGK